LELKEENLRNARGLPGISVREEMGKEMQRNTDEGE
jgi:hypothetical protein